MKQMIKLLNHISCRNVCVTI